MTISQIPYPLVNGFRQSFVSTSVRFAKASIAGSPGGIALSLALRGYTKIKYKWKRTREMPRGNHPDPLGKTRGENEYTCEAEYLMAEANAIVQTIAQIKSGFGDLFFDLIVTHAEQGTDTVTDSIIGCTLDSLENDSAQGAAPTKRAFEFSPLKILWNGQDNNAVVLRSTGQ